MEVATELGDVRVVRVEHGGGGVRQGFNQFVLGAGDVCDRIKELEMNGRDAGDNAGIRRGNLGQRGDLPGMVHAHLHHCYLMLCFEFEQL